MSDSLTFRARLSKEEFDHIAALLDTWSSKQHCTRKELESLIGHLWQHACKVIPPGRPFLRQIIYLLSAFWRDDHQIRLNSDFRFNLTWWREVFHYWDSFSFLLLSQWAPLPDFHFSSVAVGAGGYGAIFNEAVCWRIVLCSTTFIHCIQGIIPGGSGSLFVGPCLGLKTHWISFPQYGCGQCLALGDVQGS